MRCKLSGKRKTVILNVDIPPGSQHGTLIIFQNAGHERKDGTRQNINFILEEEKHEKFVRLKDDLVLDVRLPWVESLKKEMGVVYVKGLDGKEKRFEIDFKGEGNVTGTVRIEGAGMPVPATPGKRGCMVVRLVILVL
ncbi:Protein psi1 [Leucoagaricus sp. SymC.cos]|nr:Protein psi1 [Leucoagaricus sp. SymC.cos]